MAAQPSQFGISCKQAEGATCPIMQVINENFKQSWPWYQTLGTFPVTHLQLDFVLLITNLRDWFSIQAQLLHLVTQVLQAVHTSCSNKNMSLPTLSERPQALPAAQDLQSSTLFFSQGLRCYRDSCYSDCWKLCSMSPPYRLMAT